MCVRVYDYIRIVPEGPGRDECRVRCGFFVGGSGSFAAVASVAELEGRLDDAFVITRARRSSCSLVNGAASIALNEVGPREN